MQQAQQQIQRGIDEEAQARTRWSSVESEERDERHGEEALLESGTDQDPMSKEEGESETALIRCLKATRWVVVSLVILITVTAIGTAIFMAIRPVPLYVSVACGTVGMSGSSPQNMSINFTLHFYNPSGRAGLRYANATFELFGNTTTLPGQNITSFDIPPPWVGKKMGADLFFAVGNISLPGRFAGLSNGTTTIDDATVKIEGLVQTLVTGLKYTPGRFVRYYCSPLTIGHADTTVAQDVPCSAGYPGQPTPKMPLNQEKCRVV